jgi:hypothetical protein
MATEVEAPMGGMRRMALESDGCGSSPRAIISYGVHSHFRESEVEAIQARRGESPLDGTGLPYRFQSVGRC